MGGGCFGTYHHYVSASNIAHVLVRDVAFGLASNISTVMESNITSVLASNITTLRGRELLIGALLTRARRCIPYWESFAATGLLL